jgi:solute carrier family 45 protein 1/2/4
MEEKWPLWKLVLIALPQVSVQVLWCFIGPNSASYMRHLGLTDSLATLNNIAGPITGFFTGPIVGATSDNLTSRFGRRRPVILAGLISVCIAGTLFSTSEYFMPEGKAVYFAAPMYWVLDVTINVLQTPHRALVADLATEEQQIPMQVAFVVLMSIGNFMAFSIMKIYKCPVHV